MKISDFFRYADLVAKFGSVFNSFKNTPVGASALVPKVVFNIGNQQWETDPHQARRLK